MRPLSLFCLLLLSAPFMALHAQKAQPKPQSQTKPQSQKKQKPQAKTPPKPESKPQPMPQTQEKTQPNPAPPAQPKPPPAPLLPERKLESLLLMPEPKAMRGAYSITLPNSQKTVFTCFRESTTALTGVEVHSKESFTRLGLSVESFAARARTAADKRLLQIKPELIKGEDGKIAYAVYRGDSSLYATLLVAPSLPQIFAELFGPEIWVAAPDRHALYIFPAKAEILQDFADDLAERYNSDPYAASCEIFALKVGSEPRVVASFSGEEP